MKKRFFSVMLVLTLLISMLSLYSCGGASPEEGTFTRMTVDINPSVEFMIDDDNKVAAVTALNDDGSILIAGEAFIGKTPDEATELIISLAAETGYLTGGEAQAEANTVKISVSGDTKYARELADSVEKKAADALDKLDIGGKVERLEAMNSEALRALALSTSLYSEEEIAEMSDKELYSVIAAGRIETAMLITEEMREAYFAAKEHKISFAESEATAKVIEAMGGIHTATYKLYKTALDAYSRSITALDELRYNTLVSPESEYQKSLANLREAKAELLKQRTYTATLAVGGEEYSIAIDTLAVTEEQYDKALAALEQLGEKANLALEQLVATLRASEEALRGLENMFSDDIKAELTAKAQQMEEDINAAKNTFFTEFENAHKDDITAIEASLKERKQALMASVGN